jgi:hypothetical protein
MQTKLLDRLMPKSRLSAISFISGLNCDEARDPWRMSG